MSGIRPPGYSSLPLYLVILGTVFIVLENNLSVGLLGLLNLHVPRAARRAIRVIRVGGGGASSLETTAVSHVGALISSKCVIETQFHSVS